jgi:hypothetical protein
MRVMRMRVRVGQQLMAVPVRVRHLLQLARPVFVLVMLVVLVFMSVFENLVSVCMIVDIGAEQERAGRHPEKRHETGRAHGLTQEQPGKRCGEARRKREERPRVHNSKLAQSTDEQHDRDSIGDRSDQQHHQRSSRTRP